MRILVGRRLREADDELGGVALLTQEPVEDEGADEAPRTAPAEAKAPVDGAREAGGGVGRTQPARLPEAGDERRQLLAPQAEEDTRVEPPDPEREGGLRAPGSGASDTGEHQRDVVVQLAEGEPALEAEGRNGRGQVGDPGERAAHVLLGRQPEA